MAKVVIESYVGGVYNGAFTATRPLKVGETYKCDTDEVTPYVLRDCVAYKDKLRRRSVPPEELHQYLVERPATLRGKRLRVKEAKKYARKCGANGCPGYVGPRKWRR